MKEDIKYPYIADNKNGTVVLFTRAEYGFLLKKSLQSDRDNNSWHPWREIAFKNITREYLANTYGKVESKEHAEFLIEIAIANKLHVHAETLNRELDYFAFKNDGSLYFFDNESHARMLDREQITIPLPPKQVVIGEKKSEVYMPELNAVSSGFVVASGEPLNYKVIGNGDFDNVLSTITIAKTEKAKGSDLNSSYFFPEIPYGGPIGGGDAYLVGGDSSNTKSKCKAADSDEWPKVGSKVTWGEREIIGTVKCIDNGWAWILCPDGKYTQQGVKYLKPPKTEDEKLRDEVKAVINEAMKHPLGFLSNADDELTDYMLNNFNITKKPQ